MLQSRRERAGWPFRRRSEAASDAAVIYANVDFPLHDGAMAEAQPMVSDEQAIIEVLTSQPTPAQILALQPSPTLQERVSELLQRKRQDGLSSTEAAELERYLFLEHLVRMAKARALQQLNSNA